jgi:hypothetical protein
MKYVISSIHYKYIPTGVNIQNVVSVKEAVSKEEAIGKHLIEAGKDFPDHSLLKNPIVLSTDEILNLDKN